MMIPIADLHCDLLAFLGENPSHTIHDPISNASYPSMQQGGVCLQILPVFTETKPESGQEGDKQLRAFEKLLQNSANRYRLFTPSDTPPAIGMPISVILAFENASGFCPEGIPLQKGLDTLSGIYNRFRHIFSISLTWEGENRFGGGNGSRAGLKEDGKRLLEFLSEKKTAIDLSHTSDFLLDGILNHLDKKSLSIPVIATHSNVRSVTDRERNLPDFAIEEICKRNGLIGLNFFAPFTGHGFEDLSDHAKEILSKGGENILAFGADFFPSLPAPRLQEKYRSKICFFPELPNSSCYPVVLSLLERKLTLSQEILRKVAFENIYSFAVGLLK